MANQKTRVSLEMIDPKPMSEQDIINNYAPLNSPALTGTPTAPTAGQNTNSDQIATTKFVKTAVSNLINSAPSTLDTLNELATALDNDPNFATTVSNQIGQKLDTNSANYVKSLSISGRNITVTKGNNTTQTLTTQDTHYTANLVVGTSNTAIANATTTNTNTYLNTVENGAKSGSVKITGSGATTVSAAGGTVTINSSDTHSTTHLYAGSGSNANATTANGNTKLTVADNSTVRDSITIKGTGATTVTSNASGVITVNSTDTVYTHPTYTARTGKPTANATPAFGGTFTVSQITSDSTGHVTNATDRTVKIPSTLSSTSAAGLLPKLDGSTTKYLRADGSWQVPPNTVTTIASTTGTGNAVTAITASNGALTVTKGSTFSLSNHNHNTAYTALKKSVGSATQPIYTDSNGVLQKCTYSLNKTVPADAVFTDTKYTPASAAPKAPGTAAVGSSAKYAREDHVHPLQTTITGNAATATKLATARKITVKIKINETTLTGSANFDGSGNITIDLGSISRQQLTYYNCNDYCSDYCSDTPYDCEGGGQC